MGWWLFFWFYGFPLLVTMVLEFVLTIREGGIPDRLSPWIPVWNWMMVIGLIAAFIVHPLIERYQRHKERP